MSVFLNFRFRIWTTSWGTEEVGERGGKRDKKETSNKKRDKIDAVCITKGVRN